MANVCQSYDCNLIPLSGDFCAVHRLANSRQKDLKVGAKFDSGKLMFELISPRAMRGLAQILTYGANKYLPRNWEKGIAFSRVYGATLRHLQDAWWEGENIDPETGYNHIYHALCNLMFLAHYVSYPDKYKEFDDRPNNESKISD